MSQYRALLNSYNSVVMPIWCSHLNSYVGDIADEQVLKSFTAQVIADHGKIGFSAMKKAVFSPARISQWTAA